MLSSRPCSSYLASGERRLFGRLFLLLRPYDSLCLLVSFKPLCNVCSDRKLKYFFTFDEGDPQVYPRSSSGVVCSDFKVFLESTDFLSVVGKLPLTAFELAEFWKKIVPSSLSDDRFPKS